MLTVNKIDTFYDELQVLKKVSLKVGDGETVILLGPNGHGKSTLLQSICGLLKPTSGEIIYNGEMINNMPPEKRVEMGIVYIAEERCLFPDMSILKNLKLGAYNKNARKNEAKNLEYVFRLFPRLKERARQNASTLSGGEARMLAIARGVMSCARLLAIDEPSLGLSPLLRLDVFNIIRELSKSDTSIILVEQSIPQFADIADRIYLMEEGEIVFEGNHQEALSNEGLKEAFLGM